MYKANERTKKIEIMCRQMDLAKKFNWFLADGIGENVEIMCMWTNEITKLDEIGEEIPLIFGGGCNRIGGEIG